jgi:GTP-binding protein HflX
VQVELAQLRYRLPRLRGRGIELSQQGSGIGTRGPGETQLEVDRRRIQRRITKLERDLVQLGRTRATQRKSRRRRALSNVALVGYTNAGKSTLLNRLTRAEVLVEDRLFSTLDPSTRRLRLPGGEIVLLSDTVGFVRRLPHQLVESFQSTLEEVGSADLLVHLVDAGVAEPAARIRGGAGSTRSVRTGTEQIVFTKSDTVTDETLAGSRRTMRRRSARSGAGRSYRR